MVYHSFKYTVFTSLIIVCFVSNTEAFLGLSEDKVEPKLNCPDGYYSAGGTCNVKTSGQDEDTEDTVKCPPGTVLSNGNCISGQVVHQIVIPKCPPGTRYSEGNCVPESSPIECPPGFKQVNGKCESEDSRCPSGYREENGACVPITHPTIVCPYGLVLIRGICQSEKGTICPPGFKAFLNTCVPDSMAPPLQTMCPPGFKSYYATCIPDTNQQFNNIGCPLNYVLTGGYCPLAYSNPCYNGNSYPYIQSPCNGGGYSGFYRK